MCFVSSLLNSLREVGEMFVGLSLGSSILFTRMFGNCLLLV